MKTNRAVKWAGAAALAMSGLVFAPRFFGQNGSYFWVDYLPWHDTQRWFKNGTAAVSNGLFGTGSLIYQSTVPNDVNSYEVLTQLQVTTAGPNSYFTFLRASNDASPSGGTSYYAIQLSNITFAQSASGAQLCSATMTLLKKKASDPNVTSLGTVVVPCRDGMTVRSVIASYGGGAGAIMVYVDNHGYMYQNINDTEITGGKPGIGVVTTGTNGIRMVSLAVRDTSPPATLTQQQVSVWTGEVIDFQIKPPADTGTGVYGYQVYRNGQYFLQTELGGFTDPAPLAGTNTYRIWAVDFHNNYSAPFDLSVNTPPAGSVCSPGI
jgi:hypothetical protein